MFFSVDVTSACSFNILMLHLSIMPLVIAGRWSWAPSSLVPKGFVKGTFSPPSSAVNMCGNLQVVLLADILTFFLNDVLFLDNMVFNELNRLLYNISIHDEYNK